MAVRTLQSLVCAIAYGVIDSAYEREEGESDQCNCSKHFELLEFFFARVLLEKRDTGVWVKS